MNLTNQFEAAEKAIIEGDLPTLESLLPSLLTGHTRRAWYGTKGNPEWLNEEDCPRDAKTIMLHQNYFENPESFENFVQQRKQEDSPVAIFESAADAIAYGDAEKLRGLLSTHPALTHQQSLRKHQCSLIHYVGANGVEDFRQRTPPNIIDILEILLDAGANVDEPSGLYGKGTTLGLVATSYHPKRAGIQNDLLRALIDAGADVNGIPGGWNPLVAALHNGRGEAAKFLAVKGATLDLEGAAGTGSLEIVKTYFDNNNNLKEGTTRKQLEDGFMWACEYGHDEVVSFLLDKGIDIRTGENIDMTGLHWAIVNAQLSTIQLLLERGAPLDAKNVYGGNALEQVFWCIVNTDNQQQYLPVIKMLFNAGSKAGAGWLGWWDKQEVESPELKQQIHQLLNEHGGT